MTYNHSQIAIGSSIGDVRLFKNDNLDCILKKYTEHNGSISSLEFCKSDSSILFSCNLNSKLR